MPIPDFILERAAIFVPLVLSLTVHEWAHAWTAWRLGDDTAKMLGRVSLNPMDHIDPIGTVLLPLLGVPFGWAKPVPVNSVRFRTGISMPMGMLLTAVAGPIANLLLAVGSTAAVAGLVLFANSGMLSSFAPHTADTLYQLFYYMVIVNILLACFNLLPIPPLDGSRIADALMPGSLRPLWSQFTAVGPLVLVALFVGPVLLGVNVFAWPLHWINEWIVWLQPVG